MTMPASPPDRFHHLYDNANGPLDGPLTRAEAITPHATNLLTFIPRAIMVGVSGDVKVDLAEGGTDIVLKGVPAGIPLWIRPIRIKVSGTTATDIVILD